MSNKSSAPSKIPKLLHTPGTTSGRLAKPVRPCSPMKHLDKSRSFPESLQPMIPAELTPRSKSTGETSSVGQALELESDHLKKGGQGEGEPKELIPKEPDEFQTKENEINVLYTSTDFLPHAVSATSLKPITTYYEMFREENAQIQQILSASCENLQKMEWMSESDFSDISTATHTILPEKADTSTPGRTLKRDLKNLRDDQGSEPDEFYSGTFLDMLEEPRFLEESLSGTAIGIASSKIKCVKDSETPSSATSIIKEQILEEYPSEIHPQRIYSVINVENDCSTQLVPPSGMIREEIPSETRLEEDSPSETRLEEDSPSETRLEEDQSSMLDERQTEQLLATNDDQVEKEMPVWNNDSSGPQSEIAINKTSLLKIEPVLLVNQLPGILPDTPKIQESQDPLVKKHSSNISPVAVISNANLDENPVPDKPWSKMMEESSPDRMDPLRTQVPLRIIETFDFSSDDYDHNEPHRSSSFQAVKHLAKRSSTSVQNIVDYFASRENPDLSESFCTIKKSPDLFQLKDWEEESFAEEGEIGLTPQKPVESVIRDTPPVRAEYSSGDHNQESWNRDLHTPRLSPPAVEISPSPVPLTPSEMQQTQLNLISKGLTRNLILTPGKKPNSFAGSFEVSNSTAFSQGFKIYVNTAALDCFRLSPSFGVIPPHTSQSVRVWTRSDTIINTDKLSEYCISIKTFRDRTEDPSALRVYYQTLQEQHPELISTRTLDRFILLDTKNPSKALQLVDSIPDPVEQKAAFNELSNVQKTSLRPVSPQKSMSKTLESLRMEMAVRDYHIKNIYKEISNIGLLKKNLVILTMIMFTVWFFLLVIRNLPETPAIQVDVPEPPREPVQEELTPDPSLWSYLPSWMKY